ncbi:MAG: hypothetical protein RLZZ618_2655 [Pseudomonadota bacterium]
MKITIETTVNAPVEAVWKAWTTPSDIMQWNAASDDWHTTRAAVDLRVGGAFSSRMEAKDGSFGFDFAGTYTRVVEHELIESSFGDRQLLVEFLPGPDGVVVRETFEAEETHSVEQQRQGWQAILDRFARHVESKRRSGSDTFRLLFGAARTALNPLAEPRPASATACIALTDAPRAGACRLWRSAT